MLKLQVVSLPVITTSLAFLSFVYFILKPRSKLHQRTPCPGSYPLVGHLIGILRNRHRFHDYAADLLSSTPHLTLQVNGLLGLPDGVCTANPANIDHILRSNFANYVKGSSFQSVLHDLLGHGIFNVDGDLWSAQRKVASHEFSTKSLKLFISKTVQFQISDRLMPYLSFSCDNEKVIDLADILERFAFDNISRVAFGVDTGWLDPDNVMDKSQISSFATAFDYAMEVASHRFLSPLPAIWKMKRLLNIGEEKYYKEALKVINDYAMNIITMKENMYENQEGKEAEQKMDLLSRFMNSIVSFGFHDQDEKRNFLRDIVISFILAGKDTTSTALTWFFWLIAGHPHYDHLIHEELVSVMSASTSNTPGCLTYDELKKLHFLQSAISEALRLFPPIPMNSRLTLSNDTLPDGTFVGKGWSVDYSAYSMGRMEKLWGADCREFKPERWLDVDGNFQPCDQLKFPVFHYGPRMCLGKEMANVQMKCVAAAVLYEFQIVAMDGGGCQENMLNPPYTLSLVLKMKGGLPVRLKRRYQAR